VVDRGNQVLVVYRWAEGGYQHALTGIVGQRVRAEPFDAVEIDVGRLFGIEGDDDE